MEKVLLFLGVWLFSPVHNQPVFMVQQRLEMPSWELCRKIASHIAKEKGSPQTALCSVVAKEEKPKEGRPKRDTQEQTGSGS